MISNITHNLKLFEQLNLIDFSFKPEVAKQNLLSISATLGYLQKEFDKEGQAKKLYENNFDNPDSKYYQMTAEQIVESWAAKGAESCRYGSLLDDYIGICLESDENALEVYNLENSVEYDDRLRGLCESFNDMVKHTLGLESANLSYVAREKYLYYNIPDTDCYVRGRLDALFYNNSNKHFIIVDWKSSDKIDTVPKPYTKKMLGPMFQYPALNYYSYTTQLYFYKTALAYGGYLDKWAEENNIAKEDIIKYIDILLIDLPGHVVSVDPDTGVQKTYGIYRGAYPYSKTLMDNVYKYAFKMKQLKEK